MRDYGKLDRFNEYGIDFEKPFQGLFIKQTNRYKYTVNHTKKVYYSLEETVASGIAVPDSQREIACRDTFSFLAKSSCDIPLDFLNPIILSDSFI